MVVEGVNGIVRNVVCCGLSDVVVLVVELPPPRLHAPSSADITNVFGEVRYRFGHPAAVTPHLHPFVAGRAGYSRLASDEGFEDTSRNGFLVGGGGGVEYWFTNKVAAVGSAMLNYVRFGEGNSAASESLSGTQTDLRAGLKVRF